MKTQKWKKIKPSCKMGKNSSGNEERKSENKNVKKKGGGEC